VFPKAKSVWILVQNEGVALSDSLDGERRQALVHQIAGDSLAPEAVEV
jgi:hypothetical protein